VKEALLKLRELADRKYDREVVNALLRAYRNGKLFNQEEEFFEVPLG
jgi:HD-GYP domain-containing protein (c-di-GMP phosphodiesterase class II)